MQDFNNALLGGVNRFKSGSFIVLNVNDILRGNDITRSSMHLTTAEKRRVIYNVHRSFVAKIESCLLNFPLSSQAKGWT